RRRAAGPPGGGDRLGGGPVDGRRPHARSRLLARLVSVRGRLARWCRPSDRRALRPVDAGAGTPGVRIDSVRGRPVRRMDPLWWRPIPRAGMIVAGVVVG